MVEVLGVKADLARRMPRPLPALGGHNQNRDLHPFLVNHAIACSRKCVVVRRSISADGNQGSQRHPRGSEMYAGIAVECGFRGVVKMLSCVATWR